MGKKGSDLSKYARQELLIKILETYATSEAGITTTDLFDILSGKCVGINRRTLYRDLSDLSSRIPLSEDKIDGKSRWILIKSDEFELKRSYLQDQFQNEVVSFIMKRQEVVA